MHGIVHSAAWHLRSFPISPKVNNEELISEIANATIYKYHFYIVIIASLSQELCDVTISWKVLSSILSYCFLSRLNFLSCLLYDFCYIFPAASPILNILIAVLQITKAHNQV